MKKFIMLILTLMLATYLTASSYAQDDVATKVLRSGLLGAGTGAISAGMTGGKAGKGALIGAGTGIIGSILLDAITGPPARQPRYEEDEYDSRDDLDEYYEAPREDPTRKILKDGIVGAGTGAISAGVTGGKAGQGALIGAGTGIIGNALLDTITKPSTQRRGKRYRRPPKVREEPRTKIIRKYDENGNLIYEEIIPID